MTLNCKPGDLAVIKRDPDFPENVGRYVEVQFAAPRVGWQVPGFNWRCRPIGPVARGAYDSLRKRVVIPTQNKLDPVDIPDVDLRPIRPQPDDAQDESLRYLPSAPRRTPETA